MSRPGLAELSGRFDSFVQSFLDGLGTERYHIELKREHTMRVLADARTIAREESLPPDLAEASATAALFHDAGRMPQFMRYRTFKDSASDDHARLGVSALARYGLLRGLPPEQRRLVHGAVFLHNKRTLPPRLPAPLAIVTKVVRDADKLDIYRIMLTHLTSDKPPDPVVSLGAVRDPLRYSAPLARSILNRELGRYSDLAYENDLRLLVAGWVYDLNWRASRRLLQDRGLLDQVLAALPDDDTIRTLSRQVREDLRRSAA